MTYSKDEIQAIKQRSNIVSVIESLGVQLSKNGKGYKGLCPFHEDSNPSLSVNDIEGVFNCFGCGASGDVISFVEKKQGATFQEAVAWLADNCGISVNGDQSGTPRTLSAAANHGNSEEDAGKTTPPFTAKELAETLKRSLDIWQNNLAGNAEALKYLKDVRGIHDNEAIRFFRIGFSTGSISKRVTEDSRQQLLLKETGILNEQGREVFKDYLTFPILDENGQVTEIYARSVKANCRIKHLYLKGPHKGIFNEKTFKVYDELILCEGIIDALTLFVNGFKNVSCLYGLNGFTEDIRKAITENGIKKIYFAFDREDKAREKAQEYASRFPGITSKLVNLPDGIKDINEYFVQGGYKADNFKELLLNSRLLHLPEGGGFDFEELILENTVNYVFNFEEYVLEIKGIPRKDIQPPLKVGIKTTYLPTEQFQYDTIDLFSSRSRSMFVANTSNLFGVTREDLDKHLVDLLAFIEKRDKERVDQKEEAEEKKPELSEEEKRIGLRLLKNKQLCREIVRDMTTLGYVAEDTNKLLAYLVATSRKMDDPLAAIIVSRSSAGKSRLVDTVELLIPSEDVISITTASDQSFFYFREGSLSHRLISMGEHHGMENIEYHIRELLSAKEISKVVSMKNDEGKIETQVLKVQGPIAYFMTSTNPDLNEENLSRCLILYIDESEEQTRRILEYQRLARTRKGYRSPRQVAAVIHKHRIAQRMLHNVVVRIPFAHLLDFPARKIDARRDQEKFLNLITVIAFIHQFQREEKLMTVEGREVPYIEATIDDYSIAYDLFMNGILQNTVSDIPKMARDLHKSILKLRKKTAREEGRKEKDVLFTRKMLVDFTGFSFAQVRNYMRVLEENEVVEIVAGGVGGRHKQYRVLEDSLENLNISMIPTVEQLKKMPEKD